MNTTRKPFAEKSRGSFGITAFIANSDDGAEERTDRNIFAVVTVDLLSVSSSSGCVTGPTGCDFYGRKKGQLSRTVR